MSLEKIIKTERIEIHGEYNFIQVSTATIINEGNEQLSKKIHIHTLQPDSEISAEDAEVQSVCNAVWTDEVKAAYAKHIEEQNEFFPSATPEEVGGE